MILICLGQDSQAKPQYNISKFTSFQQETQPAANRLTAGGRRLTGTPADTLSLGPKKRRLR
jgi:hypothetical protein